MPDINEGFGLPTAGSGVLLTALLGRRRRQPGKGVQPRSTDPRNTAEYWHNLEEHERAKSHMRMAEADQRAHHAERLAIIQGAVKSRIQEEAHDQAQIAGYNAMEHVQAIHDILGPEGGEGRIPGVVVKRNRPLVSPPDNASRSDAFNEERVNGAENLDGIDTNREPGAVTTTGPLIHETTTRGPVPVAPPRPEFSFWGENVGVPSGPKPPTAPSESAEESFTCASHGNKCSSRGGYKNVYSCDEHAGYFCNKHYSEHMSAEKHGAGDE